MARTGVKQFLFCNAEGYYIELGSDLPTPEFIELSYKSIKQTTNRY